MKKTVIYVLVIAAIVASCGKENSTELDTNYHLNCNIEGVPVNFNFNAYGAVLNDSGTMALGVIGQTGDSVNASIFRFAIFSLEDSVKVPLGTYTDNETRFETESVYNDMYNVIDYSAGQEMYDKSVAAGVNIQNHLIINITELTDKIVRGTFSGDYYANSEISGAIKKITNGDFYLKLQQ
ncbi:hypothetical protein [Flavihumibacter profundi]|uniref:hypothetical protein n=1 Tax=Flavihumibacter profundi TaxID=2716883 RepID=UPI001CC5DC85|nr:hypothetical protein [Flavihumibacter profundi]MBZ5855995.1 hypothetical protein [Flavihumibacter profundi]